MIKDYTTIFDTPDELADFLMLPHQQQGEVLAKKLTEKNIAVMVCTINNKE